MLVESGLVLAEIEDGSRYSFRPSFGRIATIGDPHDIVATFVALHGPGAPAASAHVMACLCDQDDPTPIIGCWEEAPGQRGMVFRDGAMPASERVILAQHLMRHGIVGKAKPGGSGGQFSERFDASEYIAAARVHLGLSSQDAEALSMTEFQAMFAMKFPQQADGQRDVPSRDQYDAAMAAFEARGAVNHG